MRLIDVDELKKAIVQNRCIDSVTVYDVLDIIDNVPTVVDDNFSLGYQFGVRQTLNARPQGECRTCIHRDPEDKKCDCGGIERQGCPFPVSDDYFCKFYEKGGAE